MEISCEAGTVSGSYSSISFIEVLGSVSIALAFVFSLQTRRGQTNFLSSVLVLSVAESGFRSLEFDDSFIFLSAFFISFVLLCFCKLPSL